jgi:hypothetical protein
VIKLNCKEQAQNYKHKSLGKWSTVGKKKKPCPPGGTEEILCMLWLTHDLGGVLVFMGSQEI